MKKALKITGITLISIIVLLIAIPIIFQSQIKGMVKDYINDNLNAQVEFSDVSLSFLRSFPQALVSVSNLTITNFHPFKDETFLTAKDISFTMSVKELFKNADEDPIIINSITVNEGLITLKTDIHGNTNYSITKEDTTNTVTTQKSSFKFDIKDYKINNSALTYIDEASKMFVSVSELNHEGKGVFSADKSELDTKSEAHLSITMDSTNYLKNNLVKLDALIDLDLPNDIYTFKENKGFINQLPLEFHGYVKLLEEGQEIDITFENPGSSFKDFLAVIPETYSKNIETVETTGDFKVNGIIKGIYSDETIPTLDINIVSNNASFKYPDLPKRVENITINTSIKNTTGIIDDTYIDINALNFKIDQDIFKSSATLKNLTGNMLVNATLEGVLNLANITKVYPIEFDNNLTGILKANIKTAFDMDAIESNAYERIKNSGTMSVSNLNFSSETFANPIKISDAKLTFNTGNVSLNQFNATTGKSDLAATGTIQGLLGFLLSNKPLQGNFNLNSNLFAVNDFMTKDVPETDKNPTSKKESFKIPAFLDCSINAQANTVEYDNLKLKNVKGTLIIKDEQAILQDMTSSLFDGQLAVTGLVSTKTETPTFNMDIGIKSFDIAQSFLGFELFQNMAPIAKAISGKLNTELNLKGDLTNDFTPNLKSLSGNALAEILSSTVNPLNAEVLNILGSTLNFVDFKKLNLNDLKTKFEFNNGQVSVKPFHIKYQDIDIEVAGSHNFDKTMTYNAVFNVPAKYLGSEVNRLIGKIDEASINNLSIPITANITGTYLKPTVKTDLTSGVSKLTNQLIEIEKQKLMNQGKTEVKNLLGNLLGGNSNTSDKEPSETKTTPIDSTKTSPESTVQKEIKNVLGGLLGGKKKKKDTIN
ncbi:AsmA-like C-terminal region-containing protein [Gaetbulibacter aquiaggeris]|uniref:AsmA-like C-terminal region-containing protein n=1 Tax=Gaetbulibacter aquiaggeris TaxID=1735373 RepID=A0ABW7MRZ4_9FLAO